MKKSACALALSLLLIASPAFAVEVLTTDFVSAEGDKIGTAMLTDMTGGTLITVDLDLPEGAHALHIHASPACDAPDFKTAGGHFNPDKHMHGYASAQGFHAGDLPNLYVESTEHIKAEIFAPHLHLSGKNGLGEGTALVVHEKADDYSTDPSGNAGARIACAVIKQ